MIFIRRIRVFEFFFFEERMFFAEKLWFSTLAVDRGGCWSLVFKAGQPAPPPVAQGFI